MTVNVLQHGIRTNPHERGLGIYREYPAWLPIKAHVGARIRMRLSRIGPMAYHVMRAPRCQAAIAAVAQHHGMRGLAWAHASACAYRHHGVRGRTRLRAPIGLIA